jgi:hypothetical protein
MKSMAKSYLSLQHEMIIAYLEGHLMAEGRVNTTDITNLFKLTRPNAGKLVKEWQSRSVLPVYDLSEKAFVPRFEDRSSLVFSSMEEAAKYIRLVERCYKSTEAVIKAWPAAAQIEPTED